MQNHKQDGRLVNTGHYAGLKFEQGWWFVHILETEFVELKPWIVLNENEERGAIAPGEAGSTDDEIVDAVERHLIEPRSSEQELLFQLFLGVSPSRMQIFPFFGRNRSPNLVGGSEPGKPQLFLTGHDSPFNNPSKQSELFTVNGMDKLALQAYNPMEEEAEARLSIHVNKCKYAVVEDEDLMKAFLQGQVPFRDHTMGLGAQRNEQLSAPGWLMDRFGDVVYTTREILSTDSPGGGLTDRFPESGGE